MTGSGPEQPLRRLRRVALPHAEVARIRAERQRPRPTQLDYHHLRLLRGALRRALASASASAPSGPALDLWCGARPYDDLVVGRRVWGLDIDRHFGGAHVVGMAPLPLRDAAFGVVVCTQALDLVDDPEASVAEMLRVLTSGGRVVATVPSLYRRELPSERLYSASELARLFAAFADVVVRPVGGPGDAAVHALGRLVGGAARRLAVLRPLVPAAAVLLALVGWVVGPLTRPLAQRWPHLLMLEARRPGA